ncbi:hypothetical protein [Streptomyces sp. NPDC056188]|uniref:hypothetical protein n=1 Tax=Streptomyces sp. NPDC056188 TaxID=3345740 RepID=UPI0035DDAD4D
MTAPAAVAVIRAAIEDAAQAGTRRAAENLAQRIAQALETAGWAITPDQTETGPQNGA